MQIGERRGLMPDHRLGMRQAGLIVAVVELDQQLAGVHELVVADQDPGDEPGDMRRERGDVAADIGVVGGFDKPTDPPPIPAVPGSSGGGDQPDEGERQTAVDARLSPAGQNAA